ncbi:hypothetical protein [Shewanella sp. CAL98-MNA-CIBAN-0140]|uniref:hypothetical protein n=1 Tax=unclassified Shewanella TaxID=196818 RepID=UPI00332CC1F6
MGGFGSGRRHDSNAVTSSYLCIDVADLKKSGALTNGCQFTLQFESENCEVNGETEQGLVWFYYAVLQGDNYKDEVYSVPLTYTAGQFGGERPWFMCPYLHCDKRVKKLYIADRLGCRHCLKLSHQSKNESRSDRMARKADKIRAKLGWRLGILYSEESKPKGMHEKTYQRLLVTYRQFRSIAILAIADENQIS